MRLLEAIIAANHAALSGDKSAGVRPLDHVGSLPLVALTCIDPRLNRLLPEVLGISEEDFIWLRNAGNIITSPMSSTMRSLALACAVKGGKEIAILGHTDCKVRQTTALELTDRFKNLGVPRNRLPDNLQEYFGLFVSENQNVIRAVDFVRQSSLMGPRMPVHGLMVDITNGKLDWVVNGYQALELVRAAPTQTGAVAAEAEMPDIGNFAGFNLGVMRFPDVKIGEVTTPAMTTATTSQPLASRTPVTQAKPAHAAPAEPKPATTEARRVFKLDPLAMFKVVGDDQKIYGPVTGAEIEQWIREGRISLTTLAQKLGYKEWKQLGQLGHTPDPPKIPLPPAIDVPRALKRAWDRRRR